MVGGGVLYFSILGRLTIELEMEAGREVLESGSLPYEERVRGCIPRKRG